MPKILQNHCYRFGFLFFKTMISEKLKEWWRKYDDVEKCRLIKEKSIILNNYHKKMVKSTDAEYKSGFNRVGIRGGKFTSLSAKAQNNTRMYLDCLEEFKYMASTI